jgi:hypothetical protein
MLPRKLFYFVADTKSLNGLDTFHAASNDRIRMRYASELTDREWSMIEPFMPSQPARGRQRKTLLRTVMDAIFYLLQSGCQWALLPP